MFRKLFNIRTGIIVAFTVLLASYGVLAVFYINSLYDATTASPDAPVDVIKRTKYQDGSTIKIPTVVTAGMPFVYETKGEKLVQTGGTVLFQITCKTTADVSQITPLGSIYSNLPKGKFDIKRSYTIPASTRLTPSEDCRLQTYTTYTFYTTDKNGLDQSFSVAETGESNSFKLVVPNIDK